MFAGVCDYKWADSCDPVTVCVKLRLELGSAGKGGGVFVLFSEDNRHRVTVAYSRLLSLKIVELAALASRA